MQALPSRSSLHSLGIALAILVAAGLSPSRASADCGDYVHIVKKDSAPEPILPKPCDGPTCSQRPLPPIAPLTVPPGGFDYSKPFVELLSVKEVEGSDSDRISILEQLAIPDPNPTSIFHPPRS